MYIQSIVCILALSPLLSLAKDSPPPSYSRPASSKVSLLVPASQALTKTLTAMEIRERYQVNADVYAIDGLRTLSGPVAMNYWKPNRETGLIESNWSSNSNQGSFHISLRFQVMDNGAIQASIEEYGSEIQGTNGPEFKDLLSKQEFTINTLEPISWKILNPKSKNLSARIIVSLREVSKPISMVNLPVAGTGISVTDNAGFLWGEDIEFNGSYVGITSHRGTLVLSYTSFPGAKKIGQAEGNQILLDVSKTLRVKLKSATSFLPSGITATVYGSYLPEKKSRGVNSIRTFTTSSETRLGEHLKQ